MPLTDSYSAGYACLASAAAGADVCGTLTSLAFLAVEETTDCDAIPSVLEALLQVTAGLVRRVSQTPEGKKLLLVHD